RYAGRDLRQNLRFRPSLTGPNKVARRVGSVEGRIDGLELTNPIHEGRVLRPPSTKVAFFDSTSGTTVTNPASAKLSALDSIDRMGHGRSSRAGTACVAFDAQTSSATPAGSTPLPSSLPRSPPSSRGDAQEAPSPPQSSVADLMRASIQAWSRDRTETEEPLLFGRSSQSHAKCSPAREWGAGFRALDRETLRASMSGWGLSVCNDGG